MRGSLPSGRSAVLPARARSVSALFFLGCLLSGCVASGPNAAGMAAVRSITVEPVQNPIHFGLVVGNIATAAAPAIGGAVGGVLAGSVIRSDDPLTVALVSQNLRLGDDLTEGVTIVLRQDGYDVVPATANGQNSDATLSLQISESTYERRAWGAIGPHLVVFATLTERATGKRIFYRIYRYDMHTLDLGPNLGMTPDDKYGFDSSSDVLAHLDIVAEGFRAGVTMIVADIAKSFRKDRAR
jgi:hypothetical protein